VNPPVTIAVLGPTCSGKTAVGIGLAQRLDGEVISCDSMQIYRGMDIGTAKPGKRELALVRHHLIDELDIAERYDASKFVTFAEDIIRALCERRKTPILVGGTGMYAKALVYGLRLEPADPAVFAAVLDEYQRAGGAEALAAEVGAVDPARAQSLAQNPRRLMRAVEVLRLTRRLPAEAPPHSELQARDEFRQFILMPEPAYHREMIRERTQTMLAAGWIDEVRQLLKRGFPDTPTARQALGYHEIADYLQACGSLEELTDRLFHRTIHYARRQRTWFRHQHPGARVIHVGRGVSCSDIEEDIATSLGLL